MGNYNLKDCCDENFNNNYITFGLKSSNIYDDGSTEFFSNKSK